MFMPDTEQAFAGLADFNKSMASTFALLNAELFGFNQEMRAALREHASNLAKMQDEMRQQITFTLAQIAARARVN